KLITYSIGFSIPFLCIIIWLASTNTLNPFLDIALNYWGLYSQINGELVILSNKERIPYLLYQTLRLEGNRWWLIPAAFVIYFNQNKKIYLLASLALCYAIYPAFTGQFFPYHYILFLYFIILLASLSISNLQSPVSNSLITNYASLIFLLTLIFTIRPSQAFLRQLENKPIVTSSNRASQIANFLKQNLEQGDKVQPLDWTGGTLLAMLQTRAPIATEYVFDFYF
ncbi:MAG: hypothetical protein JNJ72_20100, partial [Anaerolineales bacterium]|nr:hypothetical protein [Anaerolineales bacterium]